ncbi:deoxyribodipyrimidine photo-lyase [Aliiglaciecola sp. CAU 1673]|uniref:deoxyribodipyrimidine photo-lyase n=1 Tax=Aliiglaciecola sp. CAU 1673 TaxID=3032595 RepID=UPI0023DCACB3|nr:deoxyribodipyrimidine photo-lyase [Aliiglaciecola sp. CAU 1673]MDF2177590.1 deoxyribodipyrimidine photo-lyase [Aliiglaciecola sp. CAU 1673]
MSALVWLRSDLRTGWHSPLHYALENHQQVKLLFILTPGQWASYGLAKCKLDMLARRLQFLRGQFAEKGLPLHLLTVESNADIPDTLADFCLAQGIQDLYFNAEYELDERRRDRAVKARLQKNDINIGVFHDTCMVRPDQVLNQQGAPYKVFTPYFKVWLEQLQTQGIPPGKPSFPGKRIDAPADDEVLASFLLEERAEDWPVEDSVIDANTQDFMQIVSAYKEQRDFPAAEGTSRLSPYFSLGIVSPHQLYQVMLNRFGQKVHESGNGAFLWLRELAWRDFYRYVMFHFPHVCRFRCFNEKYDDFAWDDDKALLQAWQEGKTGYPIVDAAMRCLNQTGWMHNRLRMITASFLCKHLLLPWRWGEDYFMSQLIDGDFASNNGGWQWSASVGTDAAPYFRIFNPTIQSKKYDEKGRFIRRWLPELKSVPDKFIHEPSQWKEFAGTGYPKPVVDHRQAVTRTKERFSQFLEVEKQAS